jgi:hypothetical protein
LADGVAPLGQPPAASAYRHVALRDPRLDLGQPGVQVLQAALLFEPLRLRCIAAHPTLPPPDRHRQPRPDPLAGSTQPVPGVQQVAPAALPLIVGGSGDGPCPSRRSRGCEGPLALGPLILSTTQPAAHHEILPCQPAKVLTNRPQRLFVAGRKPQAGADASTHRWSDHKRYGDPTHQPTTRSPSPPTATPIGARARWAQRTVFSARLRAGRHRDIRAQTLLSTLHRVADQLVGRPPSSSITNGR